MLVLRGAPAFATPFLVHRLLERLLVLLVAIHVAAALFHDFIRKDNVLARMLPSLLGRKKKRSAAHHPRTTQAVGPLLCVRNNAAR